jgi:hypothetical protein
LRWGAPREAAGVTRCASHTGAGTNSIGEATAGSTTSLAGIRPAASVAIELMQHAGGVDCRPDRQQSCSEPLGLSEDGGGGMKHRAGLVRGASNARHAMVPTNRLTPPCDHVRQGASRGLDTFRWRTRHRRGQDRRTRRRELRSPSLSPCPPSSIALRISRCRRRGGCGSAPGSRRPASAAWCGRSRRSLQRASPGRARRTLPDRCPGRWGR